MKLVLISHTTLPNCILFTCKNNCTVEFIKTFSSCTDSKNVLICRSGSNFNSGYHDQKNKHCVECCGFCNSCSDWVGGLR